MNFHLEIVLFMEKFVFLEMGKEDWNFDVIWLTWNVFMEKDLLDEIFTTYSYLS